MPQETAATWSLSTGALTRPVFCMKPTHWASATKPPVMAAVRVPPSAWSTSQSIVIWRSPKAARSHTARKRAADQALDFLGAAGLFARRRLAAHPLMGGAGQHAIFGRHPALAGAFEEGRRLLFQAGGDQHMGIAEFDQAGAFGMAGDARFEADGTHHVGRAIGGAHGGSSILKLEVDCGYLALGTRRVRNGPAKLRNT